MKLFPTGLTFFCILPLPLSELRNLAVRQWADQLSSELDEAPTVKAVVNLVKQVVLYLLNLHFMNLVLALTEAVLFCRYPTIINN